MSPSRNNNLISFSDFYSFISILIIISAIERELSVCVNPHFFASILRNDNADLISFAFVFISSFIFLRSMLAFKSVIVENSVINIQLGSGLIQNVL
ncbi:hypothetical protein MSKU9_3311 [Komagataeibacter diospyri]|uniref:Uncharacterized protein n=1 Tax=Komagataeibacter diospyri TaxID=1932662 RepID=A0A4P5NTR4_9PROT|nr:hypothetical protein MSKU9_3311 [Komagataeibacter diospyri]